MTKIDSVDDLYDFLHLGKDLPVKYIFTLVPKKKSKSKLNLQSRIVRKFFYENSQPLEHLVMFAEITKQRIAEKVGLTARDQIVMVQNVNE